MATVSVVPPAGNKVSPAPANINSGHATPSPAHITPFGSSWYTPGKIDVFFLGITIVMCGQYMSWNIGLVAGVDTYLIIYAIMALAYLTFCCCMAELTSALPFAGGSYGLARVTLGFFPAFLIGCAETLEYTASVAIQAICVSDILIKAAPSLLPYRPLLWLFVYYIPATFVQCIGGAPFWLVSTVLGAFQTFLLVLYCCALLGNVDFSRNAHSDPAMIHNGGWENAMYVFPFSAWFFLGVEALNLASDDVQKPKSTIPIAQIACICTLMATGLCMYLTTVSLPVEGGIAAINTALGPLDFGFISIYHIAPEYATLLSLPAQYAGGYGFSWASSKLIHSMAAAKLLPPWLAVNSRYGTPYRALITGSIVGYCICLMVHFQPQLTGYILPICLLFAFLSYAGQCVGYILLTSKYPIASIRTFTNPFGLAGAVYSLLVWTTGIVAIVGFQGHHGLEIIFALVVLFVLGVYYHLVARKRQVMSEEESKILLVAHIALFNQRKSRSRTATSTSKKSSKGPSVRIHTMRSHRSHASVESFHVSTTT